MIEEIGLLKVNVRHYFYHSLYINLLLTKMYIKSSTQVILNASLIKENKSLNYKIKA